MGLSSTYPTYISSVSVVEDSSLSLEVNSFRIHTKLESLRWRKVPQERVSVSTLQRVDTRYKKYDVDRNLRLNRRSDSKKSCFFYTG